VVLLEIGHRAAQLDVSVEPRPEPAGHPGQGEPDTLDGAIARQPVLGRHALGDRAHGRRHQVGVSGKGSVDMRDERRERIGVVAGPFDREEVVVEHIDDDPGEYPVAASDPGLALAKHRMLVGEDVNPVMEGGPGSDGGVELV
jgi:hypothetical protein